MRKSFAFVVLSGLSLLSGLVSCSGGSGSAEQAPLAEGGLPPGAPLPLTGTPTDEELTEEFGVFVAPYGTPRGDGSRFNPLPTIGGGILRAKAKKLRVYVCQGVYEEQLTLESGVSVIGGFECFDANAWKASSERSVVKPKQSPAVVATNITDATRFEGFDVTAPNGTETDPSSVALFATDAGALTIARSKLVASKGLDGANGVEGVQLTLSVTTTPGAGKLHAPYQCPPGGGCLLVDGGNKTYPGGVGGVATCTGASGFDPESGGAGGTGGNHQYLTLPTSNWYPYQQLASQNAAPGQSRGGGAGADGEDGRSANMGLFLERGYVVRDGSPGTNGAPGKGGRGGNGAPPNPLPAQFNVNDIWSGNSGSGGGAGGCPGLAGTPGKGGGASVGAILVKSPLTFDAVELVAGDAGNGGRGSLGSLAAAGQPAGASPSSLATTQGAPGGRGGRAGVSGSGAGGWSVGVAHYGGAPKLLNGTTAKKGKPGNGVPAETIPQDALGNGRTLEASGAGEAHDEYPYLVDG